MPLVKSPELTAAKIRANRSNARKSTGPRTAYGKAHSALNALRHGRFAGPSFRARLAAKGEDAALYDWLAAQIRRAQNPGSSAELRQGEWAARWVWCQLQSASEGWPGKAARLGLSPQRRTSVWAAVRIPTRWGGDGWPEYAIYSSSLRVLAPARVQVPIGRQGVRISFWVRCPGTRKIRLVKGTKPRYAVKSTDTKRRFPSMNWDKSTSNGDAMNAGPSGMPVLEQTSRVVPRLARAWRRVLGWVMGRRGTSAAGERAGE